MLETLDYTIRIGSTPTFLYFDLYLYSAYAAHFVYLIKPLWMVRMKTSNMTGYLLEGSRFLTVSYN